MRSCACFKTNHLVPRHSLPLSRFYSPKPKSEKAKTDPESSPPSPSRVMDRFNEQNLPKYDDDEALPPPDFEDHDAGEEDVATPEPFAGGKVRRRASRYREHRGDYLHVSSRPGLMRILEKQGDTSILFADKVLKFTGSGKMKRRIFILTDFAIYLIDPETEAMTRRIALAAVEKMCLSKLSDNFFAIVIPTEYDLFMASTRKTELVQVMVDVTKSASDYDLEVVLSNRFEYNASASLVKEVSFEEAEGGIKTRFKWK